MLPGLVHDNPRDGGPVSVPGAVTLAHLDLDLAHLLTSGHLLHQNSDYSMTSDLASLNNNGDLRLCCLDVRY